MDWSTLRVFDWVVLVGYPIGALLLIGLGILASLRMRSGRVLLWLGIVGFIGYGLLETPLLWPMWREFWVVIGNLSREIFGSGADPYHTPWALGHSFQTLYRGVAVGLPAILLMAALASGRRAGRGEGS